MHPTRGVCGESVAGPGPSTPSDGVVHLWPIALDQPPSVVAALHASLDPGERRAADHGDAALHRRFVVARGVARAVLGAYLDRPAASLRWSTGRWGKPALADAPALRFNLAHTADVAVLAVSGGRPVGVDIERRRPELPAVALAERYFPAVERDLVRTGGRDAFLRLWTRKEAWTKAAGDRMGRGLALPVAGAGPVLPVRDPTGRIPGSWLLHDLPAPPGYAACVALAGALPVRPLWPATTVSTSPFWHLNIPDRCFFHVAEPFCPT
ncbi:4'-phosphopantetheinyl transferase family protein [Micromonospora coxensis]|uniref:4'-phosphopantetheinyl transferase n=1 Tax=Micromonospora coxensis TaxID=356852 RepID=A0A1C5K0I2_9ACTN|nr:4'-phosphopantetheinyl transferase superfamily protein [Micromonospora coxensis]SCG76334.1 4'-phosphopantetheinyl transferase [Micromonospora coxensis]